MNRLRTKLVLFAAMLSAGCGSGDTRMSVLLKDAPSSNLDEAWVAITDVNLLGSNGATRLGPATKPVTVDLLTLASATTTLVDTVPLAAGRYQELRLVLSAACIHERNGAWYSTSPPPVSPPPPATPVPDACKAAAGTLRMPSMEQSGLKVKTTGDALNVTEGSQYALVVDFDVAQSFGKDAGGSGAWVMHPVITGAELSMSANVVAKLVIDGTLTRGTLGTCTVSLTDATMALSAGLGTAGMDAQFYPPPGTYTPALVCENTNILVSQSPTGSLTVDSQKAYTITFTVTPKP